MAFRQHMITNGKSYALLRKLEMLEDRTINFDREDSLAIIRTRAVRNIERQQEKNENTYNLRSREVSYEVGQEVFRRNFRQSDLGKGCNAKLAPTFLKARVRRKTGYCYYQLEDLNGKLIGVYHAKDIRV
ncbi:uncharacterized protein LOC119606404 [Lucilia sericata]|uniref:uncharacterized protein LOC119606404 n=1 Tax=Lucilia sericata TaxID=13632 RepID=UPI0018A7F4DA|nr:uncharacterized protein LOC119606404 [Lucilia sericata]